MIGWVGDFSSDDIQEIQQASDFGTTRTDLKYRGNVFLEGGVMSKQHMEVTYDYFYGTKEVYNMEKNLADASLTYLFQDDLYKTLSIYR